MNKKWDELLKNNPAAEPPHSRIISYPPGSAKKGIGVSMLSAGVMHQLSAHFDIKDKSFNQHIANACFKAAMDVSFYGKDLDQAIIHAFADLALSNIGAKLSPDDAGAIAKNINKALVGGLKEVAFGTNGLITGAMRFKAY